MDKPRLFHFFAATSLLLFFLQALRVIFSVLFGIIYDQVFLGPMDAWLFISILLVLVAFCAPAFAPATPRRAWLLACVILAALARVGLSVNNPQVRYWSALFVLAFVGLYLAMVISADRSLARNGLLAALVLDQLFRVVGQTSDLTLRPAWLPVQIIWAVGLIGLAFWLWRNVTSEQRGYGAPGSLWGLGIGGMLFLETSLLALPNAIARWSQTPYFVIAPLLLVITCLPLLPGFQQRLLGRIGLSPAFRPVMAILLAGSILIGYFLEGLVSALALLLAQGIVMAGLICLLDGPAARLKSPGPRLALGLLFFLLLTFLNAFAFTYPYVLPLMRGLGWAVYLTAALVFGIAWIRQPMAHHQSPVQTSRPWVILAGSGIALVVAIWAVWPVRADSLPADRPLRLGTYNIHYGYDTFWHFTLDEIALTIADSGADIVALQEVDTGRLTSYAVDDAYYLSRRLRMNVAYLPTVEHLTGIALLYRGEAESIDSRLLTSLQEQTGIVHARLNVSDRPLDAYGIWMGLSDEDTQRQIDEALEFIGENTPATFGGDFNAVPDSPVVQSVRQAGFDDPFLVLGIDPPPPTDPAIDPQIRIDYVFTRGLTPASAVVLPSLASDHRMVVVELKTDLP
jgi:endonuclease/exonuclease/phosphatase family metal-dependent hydrolase